MSTHPRAALRTFTRRAVNTGLVLLVLAFVLAAVAVFTGAYQVRPVLSGSMEPVLHVGGVVVTQRIPLGEVQPHDIIVVTDPYDRTRLVVHRVTDITRAAAETTAHTKGDHNAAPDPWTLRLHGDSAYRVIATLPYVGYAATWIHQPAVATHLVPIGLGLLVVALLVLLWPSKTKASAGDPEAGASAEPGTATPVTPEEQAGRSVAPQEDPVVSPV
jgi:signal peptidase